MDRRKSLYSSEVLLLCVVNKTHTGRWRQCVHANGIHPKSTRRSNTKTNIDIFSAERASCLLLDNAEVTQLSLHQTFYAVGTSFVVPVKIVHCQVREFITPAETKRLSLPTARRNTWCVLESQSSKPTRLLFVSHTRKPGGNSRK
jgi:hypothetical protein